MAALGSGAFEEVAEPFEPGRLGPAGEGAPAGIVDSPAGFLAAVRARDVPVTEATVARAAFLVSPLGFRLSEQSATDNRYMAATSAVCEARALLEHTELARALARTLPVVVFAGDRETPDAVFSNNVFATAQGRLILGRMRHAERQREAERHDIRGFFSGQLGREVYDLSGREDLIAELTGPLVIDRGRRVGFCGLTSRCARAGAEAMHQAFDLALTFVFELDPAEYHTNVVLAVLASRAVVLHAPSFRDPAVPSAIAELYAPNVLFLSDEEKASFAGNCVALSETDLWMSARAVRALRPESRAALESWGFRILSSPLDEIEKGGGSLRCCVAEIF